LNHQLEELDRRTGLFARNGDAKLAHLVGADVFELALFAVDLKGQVDPFLQVN
jgi:hypothetical protein